MARWRTEATWIDDLARSSVGEKSVSGVVAVGYLDAAQLGDDVEEHDEVPGLRFVSQAVEVFVAKIEAERFDKSDAPPTNNAGEGGGWFADLSKHGSEVGKHGAQRLVAASLRSSLGPDGHHPHGTCELTDYPLDLG